ncbi:hypothetical protein F2Q70_00030612 [Brassica cretica]|uniref:Uncharacterized protein n=1 Tax=Brassica cretica TaxID=69181 RepID=A0A8S9FC21_BRACR|nr:hypothetical protein F2Q70_00030612 [Brassica cretica]
MASDFTGSLQLGRSESLDLLPVLSISNNILMIRLPSHLRCRDDTLKLMHVVKTMKAKPEKAELIPEDETSRLAFSLETLFSKANEPNKKTSTSLFQTRDPGRGKRTVRKRSERNDEDSYRLVRRTSDIVRPISKEVEEDQTFRDIDEDWASENHREMDEEWASETPNRVMTPMQVDDESDNSAVGVEPEDDDGDGQFVDYGPRNKLGLYWNSNPKEAMEDEEEVVAEMIVRALKMMMLPANNAATNNYDRKTDYYSSSDS